MDQENSLKNWLTSTVFEHACKKNFSFVLKKILTDEDLSESLNKNLTCSPNGDSREKIKPVFITVLLLKKLLGSVETFASNVYSNTYPWNTNAVSKIIGLLERTFEQCEFISLRKFFSLTTQIKFLDLMHLLRLELDSAVLIQKLNVHFPRWQANHKLKLEKQFFIDNPKVLEKVEESNTQCRRLILKLSADTVYRSQYMTNQFCIDMKKMVSESSIYLKEAIHSLSGNAGLTVIEKAFQQQVPSEDLGCQLIFDYLQPDAKSEELMKFIDEMETSLAPPTGGFSSCLLPFDTISEYSDGAMESDSESLSEFSCEDDTERYDVTIVQSD